MSRTLDPLHFITFEGGEGAGKSTQIRLLEARLVALGYDVVVTREPGGSPKGEDIREFILSGKGKPFGTFAEAVLFSAARIDHIRAIIKPALQRGAFVLCDRFSDSTRAYQGALGDVDAKTIEALQHIAVGACQPTLTLVLDISPDVGLARAHLRRHDQGGTVDRFEGEDLSFHRRLQQAFLDIAAHDPNRCHVISAEQTVEEIADQIWQVVTGKFFQKDAMKQENHCG